MIDIIPDEFKKGLYYGNIFDHIILPERYASRIVAHVVSNYLPNNHYYTPPLYLAIKGKPGEGKTLQALAACTQRGIMVKYLSASELSGEMEAASRDTIQALYTQAQRLQGMGYCICILLDDFHLGNSNIHSNTSHTVNAELLIGYMMNLAESSSQNRVPILLTGNDFSNTYDALLRDGRADIFEWSPSESEKLRVVQSILQPFVEKREIPKLKKFIGQYSDRSVAFFAQIRSDLRNKVIYKALEHAGRIDRNSLQEISKAVAQNLVRVNVSTLHILAEERLDNRRKGGVLVGSSQQKPSAD